MIYNQGYETNLYKMRWQFPEIPRPRPIVHLHYLENFGASEDNDINTIMNNEYK